MTNPYPVDLVISNIKYEIIIEGNTFLKGENTLETTILKKSSKIISVPLAISAEKIPESIKAMIKKRGGRDIRFGALTPSPPKPKGTLPSLPC